MTLGIRKGIRQALENKSAEWRVATDIRRCFGLRKPTFILKANIIQTFSVPFKKNYDKIKWV